MFSARALFLFGLFACLLAAPDFAAADDPPPFTRLITAGTAEYSDSGLVLQNGSGVLFGSDEQLVGTDTDSFEDVYLNTDGAISLVTDGTSESIDLQLEGASDDGSVVFIETTGTLVGADTDLGGTDVYSVVGGVPTLVSTSEADGTGAGTTMKFEGNTADGTAVYFSTDQQMNLADLDGGGRDIYSYAPAEPTGQKGEFVSTSDDDPQDNVDAKFCGVGGDVAAYETTSSMTNDDDDVNGNDTYRFLDGDVSLASTSSDEQNSSPPHVPGTQSCRGVSADGSSIAFESTVKLFADDDSLGSRDVFTFDGVATHWISTSPIDTATDEHAFFAGMSTDGDTVFFNTPDQLISADSDTADQDGYSRGPGGVLTLHTGGNTNVDDQGAQIKVVSADSSTVVFRSENLYVAGEADDAEGDFFAKVDGAAAQLVSTGPVAVDEVFVNMLPDFDNAINRRWAISDDGRIFAYTTNYQLTSDDLDAFHDVYAWIRPKPAQQPVPPAAPGPTPDTTAPVLSSAKFNRSKFAVNTKGKALQAAAAKKGATLSYSLSETATVVGTVYKCVNAKKRCSGKNKKKQKSFKGGGATGKNSLAFSGKISRTTLKPAAYVVELVATDAAGLKSPIKSLKFTIVKR